MVPLQTLRHRFLAHPHPFSLSSTLYFKSRNIFSIKKFVFKNILQWQKGDYLVMMIQTLIFVLTTMMMIKNKKSTEQELSSQMRRQRQPPSGEQAQMQTMLNEQSGLTDTSYEEEPLLGAQSQIQESWDALTRVFPEASATNLETTYGKTGRLQVKMAGFGKSGQATTEPQTFKRNNKISGAKCRRNHSRRPRYHLRTTPKIGRS